MRLDSAVRSRLAKEQTVIELDPPSTMNAARAPATHHFTVDVEEYYHVSAFERHVPRSSWARLPSRVEDPVRRILAWLAEEGSSGTFFVLGRVAERHPGLVRAIQDAGHEVASHGQDHERVTAQTPAEFRADVRRSKHVLEAITGTPVLGYRAPSFSIVPGGEWALDVLIDEGFRYDSSLYPVRRRGYGYPPGRPDPWTVERPAGRLISVPPATLSIGPLRLPAGGGGTFRHLPYGLVRAALRAAEARGAAGTFYVHPWEIDDGQPVLRVPWLTHIRHYRGIRTCGPRLQRLLREFRFCSIRETLAQDG